MVSMVWLGKAGAKGFEFSLELSLLGKKACRSKASMSQSLLS
jgi:hypothetical protein